MKKIISISLVCIFLFHLAGFYVYFVFRLGEIRKEMRSQLKTMPAEKLQLLTLSRAEFQKAKRGNDEVKVNGKMHDIARIELSNENVNIYCIQDAAEDNLLSFLDEVLKNATKDKKQIPAGFFGFIFQGDLSNVIILPTNSFKEIEASTYYLIQSSSFYPRLLVPPPKS